MRTEDEQHLEQEAIRFVKEHAKDIQFRFADPAKFPALETPVSIFIAGSPGVERPNFTALSACRFKKYSTRPKWSGVFWAQSANSIECLARVWPWMEREVFSRRFKRT